MKKITGSLLILFCYVANLSAQSDAGRIMNAWNGFFIGVNSSILVYHFSYGFAAMGGANGITTNDFAGNAVDQGSRQNTNPQVFPPRVGFGLAGIGFGVGSVLMAKNPDGFNIGNLKRMRNVGIAGIAMGAAAILLPPVIRLIPLSKAGKGGGGNGNKSSAPPLLQGNMSLGLNPSTGGLALVVDF